jgi:hypothetical protein
MNQSIPKMMYPASYMPYQGQYSYFAEVRISTLSPIHPSVCSVAIAHHGNRSRPMGAPATARPQAPDYRRPLPDL